MAKKKVAKKKLAKNVVVKKTTKKTIKISEDEMTYLVDSLNDLRDFIHSEEEVEITKELVEESEGSIPKKLIGFTIQLTDVEGDHRNDGQMVDYTFTLTSPKGKETDITTEMCLMVGWNFSTYSGKGYEVKI